MKKLVSIGLLELNSVAKGIEACDTVLKRSDINLINAYPVCPGKYIILIYGDVAAVESAIDAGTATAGANFVDRVVLPRVHEQILPAILGTNKIENINAVGILETFSVASTIIAADTSVKASKVEMIEIRLAKGLGGKSFYTLTGTVANVRSAIEAGANIIAKEGILVNKVIIADPHKDLKKELLKW